eukprot:snap_masked-scaffold_13-processed-gene-6.31-mRNA-1 protein AED:1.00 eAED:1.00 QI:0/-1/0/0/-1/1/1/0/157
MVADISKREKSQNKLQLQQKIEHLNARMGEKQNSEKTNEKYMQLKKIILDIINRNKHRASYASNGKWSSIEEIILVGTIYDQVFRNPELCKESWKIITRNFQKHSEKLRVISKKKKKESDIKRYFKHLERENIKMNGNLFKTFHLKWKLLKELEQEI